MEMSKTLLGLIGSVLVLLGFGGSQALTSDEFENAYVCDVTLEWGVFYGGISGTEYRAYPNTEDTKGYKDCKTSDGIKGIWIPLRKYASMNEIDPLHFLASNEEKALPPPEEKIPIGEIVKQVVGCGDTWCITSPDGKMCYPEGLLSAGRACEEG